MRQRTKMVGLVSHTTPTHSIMSEESKLFAKFNKGTITREELRKLSSFVVIRKKSTVKDVCSGRLQLKYVNSPQYYIKCWDKWIPCTESQYNMTPECARRVEIIKIRTW